MVSLPMTENEIPNISDSNNVGWATPRLNRRLGRTRDSSTCFCAPPIRTNVATPLPLDSTAIDAIDEIFAEVSAGRRLHAARKSLSYLQTGGDAEALIAKAPHHLVYNSDEPHDYKFSEAVFGSYAQLAHSHWRHHFL